MVVFGVAHPPVRTYDRHMSSASEFAPQTGLGDGPLGAAQAADRQIARLYAQRARALAEFCAARPASADRAPGEPGAMSTDRWTVRPELLRPVSEWATPEAAIALTRAQTRAAGLLEESCTLVCRLPGTLGALEGGLLTPEHLRPLLEHVAPIADDRLRAEIEAEVLRWVAARAAKKTITTPPQLAEKVLRVVSRRNARDTAQRALRALRDRGVFRQDASGEGLAGLGIVATEAEVAALLAAVEGYADGLDDPADGRTRGEKMIGCLLDLVLRPGEDGLPPVQVLLTLIAPLQTVLGGDAPAELNGRVIAAETARALLNALTGAGLGDGVLTELRHLAGVHDPATADPAEAGDERFIDEPGFEPWDPAMREALTAWEQDWQRRLAAGALDDPDPMPHEAWLASVAQRLASGEIDPEFDEELAAAQQRWQAEFAAGRIVDPDPPQEP